MKKILIGLTIITSFVSVTVFGRDGEKINPNPRALKTFQKEFKNATNVIWEGNFEVVNARFNLNSFRVIAYFNAEGELLYTERTILFSQLPLAVMNQVNSRFEQSTFYDIIEYTAGGEMFYTLTVETQAKKLKVKALPSGEITIEKKSKL